MIRETVYKHLDCGDLKQDFAASPDFEISDPLVFLAAVNSPIPNCKEHEPLRILPQRANEFEFLPWVD